MEWSFRGAEMKWIRSSSSGQNRFEQLRWESFLSSGLGSGVLIRLRLRVMVQLSAHLIDIAPLFEFGFSQGDRPGDHVGVDGRVDLRRSLCIGWVVCTKGECRGKPWGRDIGCVLPVF